VKIPMFTKSFRGLLFDSHCTCRPTIYVTPLVQYANGNEREW